MGKIYVEIQGGQVTPLTPSWGRPWPQLSPLLTALQYVMYFRFYG